MMTPQDEAGMELLIDAYKRWEQAPRLGLDIGRIELFHILTALQTMMTHPGTTEQLGERYENIGRQIQETLCDTPEIYALIEAGWNRAYDVDPEERRG